MPVTNSYLNFSVQLMRLSGLDDHPPEKILFVDVSEKVYC